MNTKLKIAIYSGEIPSTTFIERLIKGLSSTGCDILLFGGINKNVSYLSKNIFVKGYKQSPIRKGLYLLYYTILLSVFKNKEKRELDNILKCESRFGLYDKVKCYPVLWHKPDIFHIQWAKGLNEWIWVKQFGIKLVLSLRGAHINYSPIADHNLAEMYKNQFPKVDAFHAVSHAIASEAGKYGADISKIKVVYSGLNLSLFENSNVEPIQNNPKFHVISVGRSHWKKGYVYALDAFKLLLDQNFQFTYTIVGGVNLELRYQIKELGLETHVNIIEQVPFEEVQRLIKTSDLLFLPSSEEGIANVILEAMALGKVVLTTNCGGMKETVIDGENGFVVPIRNCKKMADKILELSNISEKEKQRCSAAAIATIRNQHSDNLMINGMLELYQNI